jgi:hypothetical protein
MEIPTLPNEIIMLIIKQAEEEYGGSHWRNHKKKFRASTLRMGGKVKKWINVGSALNPRFIKA